MEEKELILKISPNFDFIYELGMPTGKKIRKGIIIIFALIAILIALNVGINYINFNDNFNKEQVHNVSNISLGILLAFFVIKLIVNLVFQILQYKNITYNFYKDSMEYKDTFWNQQTKVIRYENIKEIEIRKNIWERINKCGIIILYTNAEKGKNKGMIIYSVKDVDNVYSKIQNLIDSANNSVESTQKENDIKEESNKDETK